MGRLFMIQLASDGAGSCIFEGNVSTVNYGGFPKCAFAPRSSIYGAARPYSSNSAAKESPTSCVSVRSAYSAACTTRQSPILGVACGRSASTPLMNSFRSDAVEALDIKAENVAGFGLMISERQAGPFCLETSTISTG